MIFILPILPQESYYYGSKKLALLYFISAAYYMIFSFQWAKIIIVLERTFSGKDLVKFQEVYSVDMIGKQD